MVKKRSVSKETRIVAEIANYGGEGKLVGLSPEQRALWDEQALVLSYLRETGNLGKAAKSAGVAVDIARSWYKTDELDFRGRQSGALAEIGWQINETLLARVMSGEIKSPAIIKMVLERNLPEIYGRKVGEDHDPGNEAIDILREARERDRQDAEAAKELRQADDLLQGQEIPDAEVPDLDFNYILQNRRNYQN